MLRWSIKARSGATASVSRISDDGEHRRTCGETGVRCVAASDLVTTGRVAPRRTVGGRVGRNRRASPAAVGEGTAELMPYATPGGAPESDRPPE